MNIITFIFSFILGFYSCTHAQENSHKSRSPLAGVPGGIPSNPGDFKYQVLLVFDRKYNGHLCGAAIIDDSHVITAAHCVTWIEGGHVLLKDVMVQAGSKHREASDDPNATKHAVVSIIAHEQYNKTCHWCNDIAILKVSPPFSWDDHHGAVELPSYAVSTGTNCVVSGWGKMEPGQTFLEEELLYAQVTITAKSDCVNAYSNSCVNIGNGMVCADSLNFDVDTCMGDSGGPLVCNDSLVGITSFGSPDCSTKHLPGVYTYIHFYKKWIMETIKKSNMPSDSDSVSAINIAILAILISSFITTYVS